MPALADARPLGQRFVRFFQPSPNNQVWNTVNRNLGAVSRAGSVLKGSFLKDTAGVLDICTTDDVPAFWVYEVRRLTRGEPSKTNLIASGDAGIVVAIDLAAFPNLQFECTDDAATSALSIYGQAVLAGNDISAYYFSLVTGTPAGSTDNDDFGPNTPSPLVRALASSATTTSTGKHWKMVSLLSNAANEFPYGYIAKIV